MAMAEPGELAGPAGRRRLKVEDNRVKAQSEFTADVISALETYVATSQEDTTLRLPLTSHTPKVRVCHHLEVDNDFLLSKGGYTSLLIFPYQKIE